MDKHGTDARGVSGSMAEATAGIVTVFPLAGKPAPKEMLVDLIRE
jgi:hypothetical protein